MIKIAEGMSAIFCKYRGKLERHWLADKSI
jgi:hypothetical protein